MILLPLSHDIATTLYSPSRPTLKHQRPQPEKLRQFSSLADWYKRGDAAKLTAPVKFRKGACENCGSMTHKKKDCVEVCVWVCVWVGHGVKLCLLVSLSTLNTLILTCKYFVLNPILGLYRLYRAMCIYNACVLACECLYCLY